MLKNINLSVDEGEIFLIIGDSGCGKTTLLKMLKPELTPFGKTEGELFFSGNKITSLQRRLSAEKIGFIMQDPDAQIATDKVYSELAFGLENLGYSNDVIRSRVGEFASYFGLTEMFEKDCNILSGGQKQLLNLASVMVLNPEVIILDEPTSQLDPIASEEFIHTLKRLNDDFGTTVIIAEHSLNEMFSLADRVVYLENGMIGAVDTPRDICPKLQNKPISMNLPIAYRAFCRKKKYPLSVKEGRRLIKDISLKPLDYSEQALEAEPAIMCRDLWFRYEKRSPDVLKSCDLRVNRGEIYALLGANGCGKSTLLNVIGRNLKPYRGKLKANGKTAFLPQNPRDLFVKDSVEKDFAVINNSYLELSDKFGISALLKMHPYDLSGGELQRAAVVKILLTKPDILLLDEPTKGLDVFAKNKLGEFLREINKSGCTVITATHDLEFAAEFSDRCGLLFDGVMTSENTARKFFSSNLFYTTAASRMTKGIADGYITPEDISRGIEVEDE